MAAAHEPDGWDALRTKLASKPRPFVTSEHLEEGAPAVEFVTGAELLERRDREREFDAMVEDEDSPQMLEYALERWTGHRVRAFLRRLRLRRRPRS